jgi:hypothetical protein
MEINFLLIYIFGILLIFVVSTLIKSTREEDQKYVDFFQQLAIRTGLDYFRNDDNAYPFVAGNYFARPTKLEFLNVGDYEGVLPTICMCITIQLVNTTTWSLEIEKRDFFNNDQSAISNPDFQGKYVVSSSCEDLSGEIMALSILKQKLVNINFDSLTIKGEELKMWRQGKEDDIEFLRYCLRSLHDLASILETRMG